MTGALALALIVVRFVGSAAIARPLSDERRLDVEHPHETVRTLRAGCALDARTRLDAPARHVHRPRPAASLP